MRDKPKTTPRTQRFLSKRRSTIIAWLSWEDSDDSDSQTHQPSRGSQFPVANMRVSMVTERKSARSTMQNRHITLDVRNCTDRHLRPLTLCLLTHAAAHVYLTRNSANVALIHLQSHRITDQTAEHRQTGGSGSYMSSKNAALLAC